MRAACVPLLLADLLVKETQRRNTFLLYAEAPAAAAAPEPPAASRRQPRKPQQAQPPPQQQRQQEQQAAVVGYIVYTTTGLNAHISKLAVAPDWRRRGVARSLVRAAVGSARAERRVASVSLHVDAENAPALGLYQGEGFASEALLEVRRDGAELAPAWRAAFAIQGWLSCLADRGSATWLARAASCQIRAHLPCLPLAFVPNQSPQDYYCRGRHAHKMRLELGSSSL